MKRQVKTQQYFFTLNLIVGAQALALATFALVVLLIESPSQPMDPEQASLFQYMAIGLLIAGLVLSQLVPKQIIGKVSPSLPFKQRVPKYFTMVIFRIACLEMPGLFVCAIAFISGQTMYVYAVPLLLLVFYLYRPRKEELIELLKLTPDESKQLDDPNAIISEFEYTERN